MEPLVTIGIACYNHEKYIAQCIESALNQTYKNIQLLVVDDGSKDNSRAIIKELADKHGFHYEFQQNTGVAAMLNRVMKDLAKGKYISMLGSDDYLSPTKIEKQVAMFESLDNSYGVVCGDATFVDKDNRIIYMDHKWIFQYEPEKGQSSFIKRFLQDRSDIDLEKNFGKYQTFLSSNYIPIMSALLRRDVILEVGGCDPKMLVEDLDLWLKISKNYKMKYMDESFAFYRKHATNVSDMYPERVVNNYYRFLAREKNYSFENKLRRVWLKTYIDILKRIILFDKNYKLAFKYLMKLSIIDVIVALFKK